MHQLAEVVKNPTSIKVFGFMLFSYTMEPSSDHYILKLSDVWTGSKQWLLQWAQLLNQQPSSKNLLDLVISCQDHLTWIRHSGVLPGFPSTGMWLLWWSQSLRSYILKECPEMGSIWGLFNVWIWNITTGRRLWILTVRLLPGPFGFTVQKEGELELSSLGDSRLISFPCLRKQWYPRTWEHIVLVKGLSLPRDSLCIVCSNQCRSDDQILIFLNVHSPSPLTHPSVPCKTGHFPHAWHHFCRWQERKMRPALEELTA